MKTVLITGAAGFIGYHLSSLLAKGGYTVIGIDSLNSYYDTKLKNDRLAQLKQYGNFSFHNIDISDKQDFDQLFRDNKIDIVVNLAAQAGVRYSIENPYQYIDSNIIGFMNVLEACRNFPVEHLIFASSSSVYGSNRIPFSTDDHTDHPISLYAATKKANEAMAHSYAALYNIPTTGLRFFTVYGPWGRPDMAYYLFTQRILNDKPIQLFNDGNLSRDFTYIDDIVKTIDALITIPPAAAPAKKGTLLDISESFAPYRLYNIGNHKPVQLKEFVSVLEELIGKKAIVENLPMQPGDMFETYADIDDLTAAVGFAPQVDIRTGLKEFVDWYKDYYKHN
ncbi:MAG TPA: NAD-dependent epimerase [Flavipsychrobacter sp.]